MNPGEVITLHLTFEALASTQDLPDDVTLNTAYVYTNPSAEDDQEVEIIDDDRPNIDFRIDKTDNCTGTCTYDFNEDLIFEITITNEGDDTNQLRFEDTFDSTMITPDLTNASMSIDRNPVENFNDLSGIANMPNSSTIVIDNLASNSLFNTIENGEAITINIPFTTRTTAGATTNEVEIRSGTMTRTANEGIIIEDPDGRADIDINKRISSTPGADGVYRLMETISYEIIIENTGSIALHNDIRFVDDYDAFRLSTPSVVLIKRSSGGTELARVSNLVPNSTTPFTVYDLTDATTDGGGNLGGLAPNEYYVIEMTTSGINLGWARNWTQVIASNPGGGNLIDQDEVRVEIFNLDTDF